MGQHIAGSGRQKGGGGVRIDTGGKLCRGAGRLGKGGQNLRLTHAAVGRKIGQPRRDILHRFAMARQHPGPPSCGKFVQRGHIGPHVAIGR